MFIVKAKVGKLPRGLGWRRKGIPGGETKKESLGVSREQLTVQLGKITDGRRDSMGCQGQPERRAWNARLTGPDLLQAVAGIFEGFKVE